MPRKKSIKKETKTDSNQVDKELKDILESRKANIKVFGIGGAGGNTISRMSEIGIVGAEMYAINTDAQDLLYTNCENKILIGKELTKDSVQVLLQMLEKNQPKKVKKNWKKF